MKTVVTVNTVLPTIDSAFGYHSGNSLLDYDIVLFDPAMPYESRINFSGGGSCITIDGTQRLKKAMAHWLAEFSEALKSGKTIFIILTEFQNDRGSNGYTTVKGVRQHKTFDISNYEVLPTTINLRNAKGKHLKIVDSRFKGLYDAIKDIVEYKVVFTSALDKNVFTTKDGSSVVSGALKLQRYSGNLVFLPNYEIGNLVRYDEEDGNVWTDEAIIISKKIVNQLIEIDKVIKAEASQTPKPEWLKSVRVPKQAAVIETVVQQYEDEIATLKSKIENEEVTKKNILGFSALLYENGKELEQAIERSLALLGYDVKNFRDSDLEIDHIIVGPNGKRMIGESEGKDSAAIDISKFRQLETNINEDFEREEISEPAKGLLFANGFRFTEPSKREVQFTQKCLTNAKRLGTALVKTIDLYEVVVYIFDNPTDEVFKQRCRSAIENTHGEIVQFPSIGQSI